MPLLNSNVDRLVIYGKVEKNQMLRGGLSIYDKLKIILYSTALSDCYEIFGEHCFLCIEGFAYAALRGDTFDAWFTKRIRATLSNTMKHCFIMVLLSMTPL